MGEINTVTISLDRFEKLLIDSHELKQVNADIMNIRAMVFEEIADDCRKYGKAFADGKSTAIMCWRLFHKIEISNPSAHPAIQEALKEYEAKKAEEAEEES